MLGTQDLQNKSNHINKYINNRYLQKTNYIINDGNLIQIKDFMYSEPLKLEQSI